METDLVLLFALLRVLVKHVTKVVPTALRDKNGVTKIALHFADGDVPALCVLFAGKEKIFVFDTNMPGLRSLSGSIGFAIVIFFDQLLQVVVKLFHTVGGNEDLKARVAARKGFGYFEKPSSSVFLINRIIIGYFTE